MTGFVTKKIGRRRTLGSILKTARTKADLSLEQAEGLTKIRLKYLVALEEGNYRDLPAEAYNVGFVRVYAETLKLNPEKIVSLYRQERSIDRFTTTAESGHFVPKRLGDWRFLVTPKVLAISGMILLFGSVASYIGFQLNQFTKPPSLEISNVPSEFTSDKDSVQLAGRTTSGAAVFMNAEPIFVTADGQFTQEVQLSPGVNEIVVLAKNRAEKEFRQTVKVLYRPNLAKADQSGTN